MSWPVFSVALFIAMIAIVTLIAIAIAARAAWQRGFPSFECRQRQTFALMALALGELALTLLWVALYLYDFHAIHIHGETSALAIAGQRYLWRLMIAHAATMGIIAIGDVVSARIGEWFEIRRGE